MNDESKQTKQQYLSLHKLTLFNFQIPSLQQLHTEKEEKRFTKFQKFRLSFSFSVNIKMSPT